MNKMMIREINPNPSIDDYPTHTHTQEQVGENMLM